MFEPSQQPIEDPQLPPPSTDTELPPPDSGEPSFGTEAFQELQDLLAQAGARVTLDALTAWTPEECDEASEWARAQIEARANDEAGQETSVRWPDHVSDAHEATTRPATEAPALAPVAENIVTRARCPQCTSAATWKGPITPDMIARTFTRGINAETGLPKCPNCGCGMDLVEVASIESAISQAAEQLPDRTEARQPSIPGLHPPFDFESAFLSIMERGREVRRLNAIAERKSDDAKKARKVAEAEQTELSALEAEYDERSKDAIDEAAKPPEERRRICAAEAKSGKPCPICRPKPGVTITADAQLAHRVLEALDQVARVGSMAHPDLRNLIAAVTEIELDIDDVQAWSIPDDQMTVITYLQARLAAKMDGHDPSAVPKPALLGRYHIVGDNLGACKDCGALLNVLAEKKGMQAWPVGTYVGLDCDGKKPSRGPQPKPETPTAEPVRRAKPRHATTEARQKAKQAAAREERQPAPKAAPKAAAKKPAKRGSRR